MIILTIRSDNPEAEVGLFDGQNRLAYETWHAHRELSVTLHAKIKDVLASQNMELSDVQGIVGFAGPGSFTGLRIGLTVANALAYGLPAAIVGSRGDDWIQTGIAALSAGTNDRVIIPEYGAPVHITEQRK